MDRLSHPISQMLDAVASGGRPPADEVDSLVAALTTDRDPGTDDELRLRLETVIDDITAARGRGESGEARNIARHIARRLVDEFPASPPPDTRSIKEIVDSIRPGGGGRI